jgi:hypothetical protein
MLSFQLKYLCFWVVNDLWKKNDVWKFFGRRRVLHHYFIVNSLHKHFYFFSFLLEIAICWLKLGINQLPVTSFLGNTDTIPGEQWYSISNKLSTGSYNSITVFDFIYTPNHHFPSNIYTQMYRCAKHNKSGILLSLHDLYI